MRAQLDTEDVELIARRVVELLREEPRRRASADEWLTTGKAAKHLGITPNALHKLTSARKSPFSQVRPGGKMFFRRGDLDSWRESQGRGPAS